MKRFWLMLCLALGIILGEPTPMPVPFEMRIVDEHTGIGVPRLRVTTGDGMVCHTQRGTGACFWWASSLMSRSVRFEINDETNQFDSVGTTLRVSPGGQTILTIHRRIQLFIPPLAR
jgi:hypothetical protein